MYDSLIAARERKYLWERWQPQADPTEVEAIKKHELDLQKILRTADKRVVLNLRIMHKVQRRWRGPHDNENTYNSNGQKITGRGSGKPPCDDIAGFSA